MFELSNESSSNALPSSELVALALQGDEEAFTTLYLQYTPELRRYVNGLTHNQEDRDEIVAETFIKAWQNLVQLGSFEYFRAWLYQIATNVARDQHRREKIRPRSSLEATGDDVASSHRFETLVEEAELVKLALQEVPWKHRVCLLLSVEGKCSLQEIATIVKVNSQTVPTYIYRGRERLRRAYHRLAYTKEKEE